MRAEWLTVICVAACVRSSTEEVPGDAPSELSDRDQIARYHAVHELDLAHAVALLLVHDKVACARTLGRSIAETPADPGDVWNRYTVRMQNEAAGVAYATSRDDAISSLARLTKVCAECHASYEWSGRSTPLDTSSTPGARHVWAANALWDGMIGNAEVAWLGALDVFAIDPVAAELQPLAQQARTDWRWESIEHRSSRFGEILRACAACHERDTL